MAQAALRRMTVAEFLDWDSGDDRRYELVGGVPLAMAPTSANHARLTIEIGGLLREALGDSECFVSGGLGVAIPSRDDQVFIPDVVVSCEPLRGDAHLVANPLVLFEILSPSTEHRDRHVKLPGYQGMPSVREIVLLDSRIRFAEVYRRREKDAWVVHLLRFRGETINLPSLGVELPLDAVYGDLDVRLADDPAS